MEILPATLHPSQPTFKDETIPILKIFVKIKLLKESGINHVNKVPVAPVYTISLVVNGPLPATFQLQT